MASSDLWSRTLIVSAFSCFSLLAGFLVQTALASFFGAGRAMDAYWIAVGLPTLLSGVVNLGTFYALMPQLVGCLSAGEPDEFWNLARSTMAAVGGISFAAVLALILVADKIIAAAAPGIDLGSRQMAAEAFRIIALGLVFEALRAVLGTVNFAQERYFHQQMVTSLFSPVMLACVVLLAEPMGINAAAIGWLSGSALLFVFLLVPLARPLFRLRFDRTWAMGRIPWRALAAGGVAVALFQSPPLIDRAIASGLAAGSIASLGYGAKVLDILMRVVPMALGLASFPRASEYAARREFAELRRQVRRHVRAMVLIALPMAVALAILRVPILTLFLQRGAFDAAATNRVADVLVWHMAAFVPMSVLATLTYTFFSLGRLGDMVALGALNVGLTFVGDVLLSRLWGAVGIAMSAAGVAVVLAAVAWALLERGAAPAARPVAWATGGAWLGQLALGAGTMAFAMHSMRLLGLPGARVGAHLLLQSGVAAGVGISLYVGTLVALRNRDMLAIGGHLAGWFASGWRVLHSGHKEAHAAVENSG